MICCVTWLKCVVSSWSQQSASCADYGDESAEKIIWWMTVFIHFIENRNYKPVVVRVRWNMGVLTNLWAWLLKFVIMMYERIHNASDSVLTTTKTWRVFTVVIDLRRQYGKRLTTSTQHFCFSIMWHLDWNGWKLNTSLSQSKCQAFLRETNRFVRRKCDISWFHNKCRWEMFVRIGKQFSRLKNAFVSIPRIPSKLFWTLLHYNHIFTPNVFLKYHLSSFMLKLYILSFHSIKREVFKWNNTLIE